MKRLSQLVSLAVLVVGVWATADVARTIPVPFPTSDPMPARGAPPQPLPGARKATRFVFTFEGRGFGHGIGMSQYGAYGAALAGRTAEQIIASYYRGTTLATLPVTPVRVLLASGLSSVTLASSGGWSVTIEGTAIGGTKLLPDAGKVTVARAGAGLSILGEDGTELAAAPGAVVVSPVDPAVLSVNGARYRGAVRLLPDGTAMTAVNHVDLEHYLPGVVPREMPPSWGDRAPAALEAQAIAARSYAMATKRSGGVFDMYRDERSQVYGGVAAEDARSNRAVLATAGKVVTLNGEIVTTFFFSTSGGMTENVENVFRGSPRPYLVAVSDAQFDRLSPHHVWKDPKTFTDARLASLVGLKSPVLTTKVLQRGASPRVKLIRFVGRNGTSVDLRGTDVRSRLGLRDTWFAVRRRVRTPETLKLVTAKRTAAARPPTVEIPPPRP